MPRPTDPRPNTAVSQNRFAPLSIEPENTWKYNNSNDQSNYDRGTNNYIKRLSLIISFNAQMQMP